MKVEVNLTLVKGHDVACTSLRRPQKEARECSSPAIKLLISQENQQARRLDPTSLTEARSLFLNVTRQLSEALGESLAEVHLLDSSCLIRLP